MSISRDDSLEIKGVAIICMMLLHFWGYPSWILPEFMYKGVLVDNDLIAKIGSFGNVCVALFTFLVGYGFCITASKWNGIRYRFRKLALFLSYYWVYCILFWIVGLLIGEAIPSIDVGLLSFLGLANEIGIEMAVPFAWYVGFYVSCILLYPIIRKLFVRNKYVTIVISIIIWLFLFYFFNYLDSMDGIYWVIWNFFRRFPAIINLIIGWYFAKYDIFNKISVFMKNTSAKILIICLYIFILVAIKLLRNEFLEGWLGILYAIGIIYVVLRLNLKSIPVVGKVLMILGKYSMGMWFASGFFYLPSGKLQGIAFWGGNLEPIVLLVWILLVTFVISFLITTLFNRIVKHK